MVRGMRIGGRNGEQHCCGGDRSRKDGQKLRHSRLRGLAGNPGSMVGRASGASADAGNPRVHPVSGVIDDPVF
jgi:hypothetical protein